MGKAIIKEFRNHPLGTTFIVFGMIAMMVTMLLSLKATGADENQLKNDIESIAGSVEKVATKVEKHIEDTSYKKQVEQFPTRREYSDTVIHIQNSQKELKSEMIEQRKLSVEILKRLPQDSEKAEESHSLGSRLRISTESFRCSIISDFSSFWLF